MNCRIWLVENRYRFDAVSTDIQEMMRLPIGHLRVFQSVASVRVTKCLPLTFVAVRAPFLIALITCWRERPVWAATSATDIPGDHGIVRGRFCPDRKSTRLNSRH